MPPFGDAHFPAHASHNDLFVRINEDRMLSGKAGVFSTLPIGGISDDNSLVFSQRDVMIGTNPLYESYLNSDSTKSTSRRRKSRDLRLFDLIDQYFNCMCGEVNDMPLRSKVPSPTVATATRKSIVYPIAKYPERLNSPVMVEKRRKSMMKHLTFQPVKGERE